MNRKFICFKFLITSMIQRFNTPDRQDKFLVDSIKKLKSKNQAIQLSHQLPSFYLSKTKSQIQSDIKSKLDILIEELYKNDNEHFPEKSYEHYSCDETNSQNSKRDTLISEPTKLTDLQNLQTLQKMVQFEQKNNDAIEQKNIADGFIEKQENNQGITNTQIGSTSYKNRKSSRQLIIEEAQNPNIFKQKQIEQKITNDQNSIEEEQQEDSEQTKDFKQFKNNSVQSLGMQLYSNLIIYFIALFIVLTANAIFVMSINYYGNGVASHMEMSKLSIIGRFIVKLSNANQNQFQIKTLNPEEIQQITKNQRIIVSVDIANSILVTLFIICWKFRAWKITRDYLQHNPQPSQYTLQCVFHPIKGQQKKVIHQQINKMKQDYPQTINQLNLSNQNQHLSEQIIKSHIIQWGDIQQISIVRKYSNFIHLVTTFLKLLKKQARIRLKIYTKQQKQVIFQHLQRKYLQLIQFYLSLKAKRLSQQQQQQEYISFINPDQTELSNTSRQISIKSVFVIFKTIAARQYIKQLYEHNLFHHSKFQLETGKKIYKIQVKPCCIKPLNINWQNYHYMDQINRKRLICQILIIFFILLMITSGLFLLNVNKLTFSQQTHNHLHYKIQGKTSSMLQITTFLTNQTQILNYVEQLKILSDYCDKFDSEILAGHYPEACSNLTFQGNNINFILMFFFSLFIFLINLFTSKILRALSLYRRYRTINEKDKFLIYSMTICSLINSALIIVLIRNVYTGPLLAQFISKLLPFQKASLLAGIQIYPSFSRKWHLTIGNQLVSNFLLSLVFMPFSYLLIYWIRKTYRDSRQKKKNILAEKKELDYCLFYALSLKAYLFCMLYAGTLPILYPFALISYFVQFIIRKISLKYFLIQPLFLDERANEIVMRTFSCGLLIHIVSSGYTIFWSDIFPNYQDFQNVKLQDEWLEYRFFDYYIYLFFGALLVVIFQNKILQTIIKVFKCSKISTNSVKQAFPSRKEKAESLDTNQQSIQSPTNKKMIKLDHHEQRDANSIVFNELLQNKKILSSYMMNQNPKYSLIAFTLDLINQHTEALLLQKQRMKQQQIKYQHLVKSIQ